MLILTKSIMAMMIGFIISALTGLIIIPLLKKLHASQSLSIYLERAHSSKKGTPTMGGLIFIIPTILITLIFIYLKKIEVTYTLIIVMFTFISYGIIGFIDDFLIIKKHNNKGLTKEQKFILQIIVATIFFYLFMRSGSEPLLWVHSLNFKLNIGWIYGIFILFILVATSNAVNLTDGLDGLAGGLSAIAIIAFTLISLMVGFEDIGIFSLILVGSLMGYLIYNTHPAKVIMGDTGSLALGATMGAIAILTHRELTLLVVAGIFVIETLSVILQTFWVQVFHKKLFLMTPIHHHFEKLGWEETDIVKLFWVGGLLLAMAGIIFGVWL